MGVISKLELSTKAGFLWMISGGRGLVLFSSEVTTGMTGGMEVGVAVGTAVAVGSGAEEGVIASLGSIGPQAETVMAKANTSAWVFRMADSPSAQVFYGRTSPHVADGTQPLSQTPVFVAQVSDGLCFAVINETLLIQQPFVHVNGHHLADEQVV